jgi:hypothetical protein
MKKHEILEKIMDLEDKIHLVEVKKDEFSNELKMLREKIKNNDFDLQYNKIIEEDIKQRKIDLVVSRYKKPVDFIHRIKGINKIFIYDKEEPRNPYNIPVNKGNEASVYLKYIVDNYDNLSDFTFFIHDEEYAWHHTGSIVDKFEEAVISNKQYYNINDKCILLSFKETRIHDLYLEWYDCFVEKYIPITSLPKEFLLGYRGSAQFLVHESIIRKLPKKFYEDLYTWIITTNLQNEFSGRFLEWSWHIFWLIYPNLSLNQ